MEIRQITKEKREEYFSDRLLSQLNFAKRLSFDNNGKYDEIIKRAELKAKEIIGENNPVTKEAVDAAEAVLCELQEEAKSYKVICASHAHIDMNWQWGWDETVAIVMDTVKTMLMLLDEFPQFYFSLSQASTYKIIKDYAPELFERVKEYVQLGRWEVTAPSWVECDKNMPNGESLAMQVYSAKKYLSDILEIPEESINLDFQPDTFGHSRNVPEILSKAGVNYYYHCRGTNTPHTVFRWQSPSGGEIIVNRESNFYSSAVTTKMALVAIETAKKQGFKTTLRVFGVGDHGGGPSRRDIRRLLDMDTWPCFPHFEMGTYREFFAEVENHKDNLPVYQGEINFVCDGCYSAQSRIKAGNKLAENSLYQAEAMMTIAKLNDVTVFGDTKKSWNRLLLNHFHDIVTGSGVEATRHYAMGEYQNLMAETTAFEKRSINSITENINTLDLLPNDNENIMNGDSSPFAQGAGAGSAQSEFGKGLKRVYHVFNTLPSAVQRNADLMLWDWLGDTDKLVITDINGETVPHQVVGKGFNGYWGHHYVAVKIHVTVPPVGYTTIIVDEEKTSNIFAEYWPEKRQQWEEEFVLENEFIRVELSKLDGSISKVTDKETGESYLDENRKAGFFRLITEANNKEISFWGSEMSGWLVGRYKSIEDIQKNCEFTVERGSIFNCVTVNFDFGSSKIIAKISLEKGSRLLNYDMDIHWLEVGSQEVGTPQLSYYLPLKNEPEKFIFDVPFATAEREGQGYDLPGLNFASTGDVTIYSKSSYGYRCQGDEMSLTLLRGSFDPDPYPESGEHNLSFAVGFGIEKGELIETAGIYNTPLKLASNYRHGGNLSAEFKGIDLEGAVISSIKTNMGKIIVRMYNPKEKSIYARLKMPKSITDAVVTDILGNPLGLAEVNEKIVSLTMKPLEVVTLELI